MLVRRLIAVLSAALCVTLGLTGSALAFGTAQPNPVSAVPSKATPNVLDGMVVTIAKVGNTVLLGGTFTSVANPGSTSAVTDPDKGRYVVAFDATTGQVNTAFAPGLDGQVNALVPGPIPGTVYAGGQFSTVGGAAVKNLVLLDVATGKRVTSFRTSSMNGVVQALRLSGNRLFVGGSFTSFQGQAHGGLAAVDATTGVVDPFVQSTVLTNHNWTAGSTNHAKGAVGVTGLDITPDGSRMVVIGNFKSVDGLPRDQVAMFDLTGSQAVVRSDWQTHGYEAACYYWAFDSWIRDVAFSPDGSYFVIVATGGGNGTTTLCDSAARFETAGSGSDVRPSWVDYTGGDSLFAVTITDAAVYTGGHPRWVNNPYGHDSAGTGAVPRPGLVALDPQNGLPLAWNPGRNPRGFGVQSLLATPDGLYLGSDTDWIGNFQYQRMKVAYFPLAGGQAAASTSTPALPGAVYTGGTPPTAVPPASVLYRINAGGSTLAATDGGPSWQSDPTVSPYRSGSSSASAAYSDPSFVDATVPDGTPVSVFATERWDSGKKGDGDEMRWAFPVPAGQQVTVRLYFVNQCTCTQSVGQRQFDVAIDGSTVLDHFDIVKATGGTRIGTMRAFPITSDGTVNIDFTHEVEHPLINAIEIVRTSSTPAPPAGTLTARSFDGTTAGTSRPVDSDLDWNTVRAPVLIGGTLFYGRTDGNFYRRSFDGRTFGPEQAVDPYNDAYWSDVSVLQEGHPEYTYRGVRPDFYGQLGRMTSAFYSDGRLYYTIGGSSSLFYRAFSPDSGTVYPTAVAVPGVSLPQVNGAFLDGRDLYYAEASTGALKRVTFTAGTVAAPGTVSGSPVTVSGPSVDGVDWRARALFLGPDGVAPANRAPAASLTGSCSDLQCSFDASGSTDPDGDALSYAWSFGDGSSAPAASSASATHAYATGGSYPVTVTVSDGRGGTATAGFTATPAAPQPPASTIAFRAAAEASTPNGGTSISLTFPSTIQPGDGLVLMLSNNSGSSVSTGVTGTAPGFTQVGVQTAPVTGTTKVAMTTQVFQKVATPTDAGARFTVSLSAGAKASLQLVAYSGTASAGPVRSVAGANEDGGTSHTTPGSTANAGDWVLSAWADKSNAVRSWSAPSGEPVRSAVAGGGTTGEIAALVGDGGRPVPATGPVSGLTATVPTASAKATMFTIVLAGGGVPPTNRAPTASFTASCSGLDCSFDGGGSIDPDGDPLAYSWTFGDGATSTDAAPTHSYTAAGDHTVGLTVSDGRGGSDATSQTAHASAPVTPPAGGLAVRATAEASTPTGGRSISVTFPSTIQPGDGMVLVLSNNSGSVASTSGVTGTAPGFTEVGRQQSLVGGAGSNVAMTTQVFQKVATPTDAGYQFTVTLSAGAKATLQLVAYSGTASGGPVRSVVGAADSGGTSHATPDSTGNAGDWVLSVWSDKSSAARFWSAPSGEVVRSTVAGGGTNGEIATLVADGGQALAATGPVSGLTATVPTASAKATMLTIVLASS